ncbi:hypothetical protein [Halomicronema sp. CCY15110]|uniref:hypothetical protein n=1 Tax=Halomicronema sp. CCY15110 TaxID=2767773 RepID=UPI00194FF367|nr:hypothetical protein [Halomicronema sp. CCY15110]
MRTLAIIGIVATLLLLVLQVGWIGILYGLFLVGLTGLAVQPSPRTDTPPSDTFLKKVVAILDQVPGITAANTRDFQKALPVMTLRDGTTVKTWKNPAGVDHIFLVNSDNQIIYGAYVGWIHSQGLQKAIAKIRRDFS